VPESLMAPSYAKINLTLEVLGKREDGFHDLISIMQSISLHDVLRFVPLDIHDLLFSTHVASLNRADNLVMRAAVLLRQEAGPRTLCGVRIEMRKAVPVQGGLGGGSGDAAITLLALNRIWGLDLPIERLADLGAQLGSDVPFFIYGGTALIEGRGERVEPLPDIEPLWLVLAKPRIGVPTPAVFQALTPAHWGEGAVTRGIVESIRAGHEVPFDQLTNSLEAPVMAGYPDVADVHAAMRRAGAPVVRMSGSGPTLFAPFRSVTQASDVTDHLTRAGILCWLCHTISREQATGFAWPR
jgi:4-diphosphocytidyl-2-C-methyl-D-erythritol kinase